MLNTFFKGNSWHKHKFIVDQNSRNQSGLIDHICKSYSSSSTQLPNYLYQYSVVSSFINDRKIQVNDSLVLSIHPEELQDKVDSVFPLFFRNTSKIKIPNKVVAVLTSYTPDALLCQVHQNKAVAIEWCLLFLSKLNGTHFVMQEKRYGPEAEGWKALHSDILIDEFPFAFNTYKKIVEALKYPSKKGPILECDSKYLAGHKCYYYRLGTWYQNRGIVPYQLLTKEGKDLHKRNSYKAIGRSLENPICKNLLNFYPHIELPTLEEVGAEGRRLVKAKFITKKGKLLSTYNKHSRDYFKDADQRSFIEDSIELFEYLTSNGLLIPQESGEKSGGRVVDSFTLMPSWIRNMCKINGQRICEIDYSALHPNIAMTLYGGKIEFITHSDIAEASGLPLSDVKQEHLSFFNKTWTQMMQSPLYEFYWTKEREMMENLCEEKNEKNTKRSDVHKTTSKKLFKKEVEIMTEVIIELNKEQIYVGYVYDALFCQPDQKQRVQEVMNEVVLRHGVKTRAK